MQLVICCVIQDQGWLHDLHEGVHLVGPMIALFQTGKSPDISS